MDFELRTISPDEVTAFCESVMVPFLQPNDATLAGAWAAGIEADRSVVAVDHGRFVANACTYTRDLTLPDSPGRPRPVIAMAAVSAVGVYPTHRRRGLLRQLMDMLHADAARRGEMIAGLTASESSIYGRFGYGQATTVQELTIDTARSAFATPVPGVDIRLLGPDEAAKVVPDLFDRLRRRRAGEINRDAPVWGQLIADPVAERNGGGGQFWAVSDDGYAVYRAHHRSERDIERTWLTVSDLYGATPEVEAALWRFVLDVDLVDEVVAAGRPVDEPLRWRLADPRQLRVTRSTDKLWVRIIDVPGALEARGYQHEATLTIHVDGPDEASTGRWVLDAGPDGASCRRAGPADDVDLVVHLADLGAIYLGGVAPSVLAAAGRVVEARPRALAQADALFATPLSPFTGTGF